MTDEPRGRLPARIRRAAGAVRVRTTLVAVLAVGVALALAGSAMVILLRRSLTEDVRTSALFRAEAVADIAMAGSPQGTIRISDVEDEFVQVIDEDGEVVASSTNLAGESAVARPREGDSLKVEVPFEDDPFLAVVTHADTPEGTYEVLAGQTLENVIESTNTVLNLLVIGLPLLLIVVGLITWRVVGRALAPVEGIRSGVETISTERLDQRVPVPPTEDEIARLANTMNEMLQRLEEGQLRQQRFVSDASHELRSPVATIRQHVEVALRHPGSVPADELARTVLAEDLRLQRLVEDLLILAHIDEGEPPSLEELDLDDVVFDAVRRSSGNGAKRIDTSAVSAGRIRGDGKQLQRLVANLVDNALRHADGEVKVGLKQNGSRVILEIDDDGQGVPSAERERVFERFVRLEEARDRDSGGAGLGLSIVAGVARAHGGTVEVLESPQGGARFRVDFPAPS